jgi:hydroxyethylthiazole kinase-like uncharacterized protein yjeF
MIPIDGQPVLTAARMHAAEERAVAAGTSLATLMQRAGEVAAEATRRLAAGAEVLILCGPGNNGGDGWVAAATLAANGHPVRVAALSEPKTDLARAARARWTGPVEAFAEAEPAPVCVDALFGIGVTRPLDGDTLHPLTRLIRAAQLSIAIDLPSGLASDTGELLGEVAGADLTLALGALKPAHLLQPAARWCGDIRLLDIGMGAVESNVVVLSAPRLSPPTAQDHKFTRGMVAIVGGRMPGAAALAATGAARIAGYVLLLGSATDRLPHAIVRRRWSPDALVDERIGAVLIGPGLGRDDTARDKLAVGLASDRPLVIDGDALHLLDPARLRARTAPTILTPHAGEFAAMFGSGPGGKIDRAVAAAQATGATIVFKGADTVVAHPAGHARVACRRLPWLATAGTGDVLAGVIGALLARGAAPFTAATTGVWLHGEAARLAGPAFIADDLAASLATAIRTHT